ncbi:MAG TPA: lipoyl(octanoyl) transferase LipB [Steroidobacteraceae bacterium]
MNALLRWLGRADYAPTWRAMQAFTDARGESTPDEVWFLEHDPVFTQGLNGRNEHLLAPGGIPVVGIDRGGQVTYHGPGQLVVYPLVDLRRAGLGVRELVVALEDAVIALAGSRGIEATGRRDAPGVYVRGRKLASIGLRIRRGCSYHGLALNVDMDLEPFSRIHPCGMAGLAMTQLSQEGAGLGVRATAEALAPQLCRTLRLGWDGRWLAAADGAREAQSATSTTPLAVRSS